MPEAVETLVEPIAVEHGLELVDVEYHSQGHKSVLRLLIDRPGGINLDQLAALSREVGDVLDVHDVVPGTYQLECSSPGVNRRLRRPGDFARYLGRDVRVRTRTEIAGTRKFLGQLVAAEESEIQVDDRRRGTIRIPLDCIERASYEHDWSSPLPPVEAMPSLGAEEAMPSPEAVEAMPSPEEVGATPVQGAGAACAEQSVTPSGSEGA